MAYNLVAESKKAIEWQKLNYDLLANNKIPIVEFIPSASIDLNEKDSIFISIVNKPHTVESLKVVSNIIMYFINLEFEVIDLYSGNSIHSIKDVEFLLNSLK